MTDTLPDVLLALGIILTVAKLGGHLAIRAGQPAVLGELGAGITLGGVRILGVHGLDFVEDEPALQVLAQLGVILLLFEVGLESTVAQMRRVGLPALGVALAGVVGSLGLGALVGHLLGAALPTALFLGAAITSTSVGISARVLRDLGTSDSPAARLTLGSAVLDDIVGLIVLAAAVGALGTAGGVDAAGVAWIVAKALLFLGGALALGSRWAPRVLRRASKLEGGGVLLGISLAFCFLLSWIATWASLAPIIGAFAAGLLLEDTHYEPFTDKGEQPLERLVAPVTSFLTPIFFVLMGMHVDLTSFADPAAIPLALGLTAAALVGKQTCLVAVPGGVARLPVGIGMMPRGEVTLLFASMGRTLTVNGTPVVDGVAYTALVLVVVLTTLATPPLLTWSYRRA